MRLIFYGPTTIMAFCKYIEKENLYGQVSTELNKSNLNTEMSIAKFLC